MTPYSRGILGQNNFPHYRYHLNLRKQWQKKPPNVCSGNEFFCVTLLSDSASPVKGTLPPNWDRPT